MTLRVSWRIILIIISAAAIAFSVYSYLDSLQQTVTVVVASEDIPAHTDITENMLKEVEIEINSANTLLEKPVQKMENIVGGITLVKFNAGQPIEMTKEKIIFPEQRQFHLRANGEVDVTYFIPKDKRLITVALDPQGSVNNALEKGDWVDVIYSTKSKNGASSAKMILQQIEVFEIETLHFDDDSSGKQGIIQHVTLLVSPQEAIALTLAKRQGNIDLILNPWNGEKEKVVPVDENALH
jgi:pilus assembly protein CpaB